MEKGKFAQLAELFGFKVNEESIEVVANEYDMAYPDNWDEMSEDEQAAWKKEHMKSNAQKPAQPAQKPQPSQPSQQPSQANQPSPEYENLVQLNQLIKDIGGMPAFKGLLLNAVEAVESHQKTEEQERKILISAIVANSSSFKSEDLEEMDVPILKKLADGLVSTAMQSNVDWRMLGARTLSHNKEEDVANPPSFLLANQKEA